MSKNTLSKACADLMTERKMCQGMFRRLDEETLRRPLFLGHSFQEEVSFIKACLRLPSEPSRLVFIHYTVHTS